MILKHVEHSLECIPLDLYEKHKLQSHTDTAVCVVWGTATMLMESWSGEFLSSPSTVMLDCQPSLCLHFASWPVGCQVEGAEGWLCFFLPQQLLGAARHRAYVCVVFVSIINLLVKKKVGVKYGLKTCRISFQSMKEDEWQSPAVVVVTKLKRLKEGLAQMQVMFSDKYSHSCLLM